MNNFKNSIKFNKFLFIKDLKKVFIPGIIISIYIFICYIFKIRLCPINYISGFPCPACGITRSFFMLLKGNFFESLKFHPFALIILIYAFYFIIGRYLINISYKNLEKIFIIIGIFMIFFYIYRMIYYYPSTKPLTYNYNSFFYSIYKKVSSYL